MKREIVLKNGSREEAYTKFDDVKSSIIDFKKESVGISGNLRNNESGWRVVKVYY